MEASIVESLVQPFRAIGAGVHIRTFEDGSQVVLGIQSGRKPSVGDEHVLILSKLTDLRAVGLCETAITDRSLHYFANLQHLETLDLTRTAITNAGVSALASLTWLEYLAVEGTQITREGIAELHRRLPNCEISSNYD